MSGPCLVHQRHDSDCLVCAPSSLGPDGEPWAPPAPDTKLAITQLRAQREELHDALYDLVDTYAVTSTQSMQDALRKARQILSKIGPYVNADRQKKP